VVGSDDFHHKRKAKSAQNLARQKAKRAPYARVLIVCEGSKTEPNYLREIVDCLELNTANIEVDGDCGSSPASVVAHARQRYSEHKRQGDDFDKVFCVFDKDTHHTYEQALTEVSEAKPANKFTAIHSVPCFEYWLLLHFEFTTRPFAAAGGKSVCACVIDELHRYMPAYTKGDHGVFKELMPYTEQAITRSKNALQQARNNGTDNPTTLMHELVEYLQQLKP